MTRTITHTLTAAAIFLTTLTAADAADHEAFLAAAYSGDVAQVQSLLADGADVNTSDAADNTALHYAAAFGYTELTETLVTAGADVDARGRIDNTPLHLAAQEGHTDVASLLIDSGADVDAKNEFGGTAFASGWGHFDIAEQIEHASQPIAPLGPSVWFVIIAAAATALVGFAFVSTKRNSISTYPFSNPLRSNAMTRIKQDLSEFGFIHGLTVALVVFLVGAMGDFQRGSFSTLTTVSSSQQY
jgi:hypothetical protein